MTENFEQISFDQRFSYTAADEAIARNPNTDLSYVYKRFNAAGQNDRFEANLERLDLQNNQVIRLAKTAFLTTSVLKKRADGLEAAHPLYVANRSIEDLGQTDPSKIAANLLHDVVEDNPKEIADFFGYKHGRMETLALETVQKLPGTRLAEFFTKRRERRLALKAIAGSLTHEVSDHVVGVSNPILLFDTPSNNSKNYQKHVKKIANATSGLRSILPRAAEYQPLVRAGLSKLARRVGIVTLDILKAREGTKVADILNNAGENDRTSNPILQLRTDVKHLDTLPRFRRNVERFAPPEKVAKVQELLQQTEAKCRERVEHYLRTHPDGPTLKEIRRNGKAALRGVSLNPPDLGLGNVVLPPLAELYDSVITAQNNMDRRTETEVFTDWSKAA